MPGLFAAECRADRLSLPAAKATRACTTDLALGVTAFCAAFVLERLFRPFRKPMIVFYRQLPPYPDQEGNQKVLIPRQVA